MSGSGDDIIKFDTLSYDTSDSKQLLLRKTDKVTIRTEDGNDIVDLGDTNQLVASVDIKPDTRNTKDLYGIDLGDIYFALKLSTNKVVQDLSYKYFYNGVEAITYYPVSYAYDYLYKGKLTVYSGAGNDLVKTGAGADIVNTGTGSDTILSGSGDDVIDAGDGDDVVITGAGADTVNLGKGADTVFVSFGDTINFTYKDGQRDLIKVDPLILDYEEGIIVESKFLPVTTTINGIANTTIEQTPVKRLGKIIIKYPETKTSINTVVNFAKNKVAYIDYLTNVVGLTGISSTYNKAAYSHYLNKGSKTYQDFLDLNPVYDQIDLSELFQQKGIDTYNIDVPKDGSALNLSALSTALGSDYIKYGQSYVSINDLNANLDKVNKTVQNISQLSEVELRKLVGFLQDKNMLQQKKGEVMLNIPIPNGAIVDVIEVHIIGITLGDVGPMIII